MAFKAIPVVAGKVSGTNTDMPLLVTPSAITGLGSITLAQAQSSRFYSDEAKTTELAREVVSADEIHVKVPSVTTTSTIYMDFDGARSNYATTDTYGAEAVWSDYELVFHSNAATDSSGNTVVTASGGVVAGDITGKIGAGTDFSGSGEYFAVANTTGLAQAGDVYIQTWATRHPSGSNLYVYSTHTGSPFSGFALAITFDDKIRFYDGTAWRTSTNTLDTTGLSMLGVVVSGTNHKYYINSVLGRDATYSAPKLDTQGKSIGARGDGGASYDGILDEMRIRRNVTSISQDWITTEYNNQNDNGTFWGTATEVSVSTNNALSFSNIF